ncbi:MAG: hypothetical protein ACE5DO_10910, partial [Desulfobacterales bacterium]
KLKSIFCVISQHFLRSYGFLLVEKLGKYYRNLDSFKNGFGKLLRDAQVQSLRKSILKRARNKFVFHFDKDVAEKALQNIDVPVINFASTNRYIQIVKDTTAIMGTFSEFAEILMADVLKEKGFTVNYRVK